MSNEEPEEYEKEAFELSDKQNQAVRIHDSSAVLTLHDLTFCSPFFSQWEESRYPFKSAVDHILVSQHTSPHFQNFSKLTQPHFQATRRLMREMGELSNVPIEPPEQTRLLDACSALPGVIGAGVPGGASSSPSYSLPDAAR